MRPNFSLIPFLFALTACTVATTPTVTPSLAPAAIPSPTQTSLPTATLTAVPTQSPLPTRFRSPTPTELPNPAASNTFNDEPTLAPTSIDNVYSQVVPSPDGKYVAKLTDKYLHPSGQTAILIWDRQGNLLWTIPYQGGEPTGDPHPGLGIYQWTQDSSALYFFYGWGSDGGGPTLFDALDLQKIDIRTGTIRRVLPGTGLMAFAFSPDQRTIAYARDQDIPRRLIIRDLVTGAERSTRVDFESQDNGTQVGWISWSPNGEHLLFHADENDNFRVIVLDIKTMTQRVLLEYLYPKYSFQSWTTDEKLRFLVYVNDNYTVVNIVNIDLETGSQSIVGTRTPAP